MTKETTAKKFKTDMDRLRAMKDEDIDYSDIPKQGPDFFKNAKIWPGTKSGIPFPFKLNSKDKS